MLTGMDHPTADTIVADASVADTIVADTADIGACPRSVYALRTHKMDSGTRVLYEQMCTDLGSDRVFVLFDDTRGSLDTSSGPGAGLNANRPADIGSPSPDAHVFVVNDAECLAANCMHDKGYGHTVAWSFWHPETSMVLFSDWLRARAETPAFEYVWFIEYDVRCDGSFAIPLSICDSVPADFMAKGGDDRFEIRRSDSEYWCWWKSIEGDLAVQAPNTARFGAFFPATRISNRMFEALRSHMGRSTGFCEVYISTLCAASGLELAPMPREVFGTFVYQPCVSPAAFAEHALTTRSRLGLDCEKPSNLLFHPVK